MGTATDERAAKQVADAIRERIAGLEAELRHWRHMLAEVEGPEHQADAGDAYGRDERGEAPLPHPSASSAGPSGK